jgi:hypothetical protein
MAHNYTPTPTPWRTRLPIIIVLVLALLICLVVGARALGLWPGETGDPDAVTVEFVTETGNTTNEGVVNSPLRVRVRIPWSVGSQDTIISNVALQMLSDTNIPATFGNSTSEVLAMKPTFDVQVWEWRGSVPSGPGIYHARIKIDALYNEKRNEIKELLDPTLQAVPETGAALKSGYVFAMDSNLWLMATDTSRQRRLTYFPEYYEYADKPQWSPDGTNIAFTYSPRTAESALPTTEIWTVAPGGEPKPVVQSHTGESYLDPAWSEDGKYLYYTVDNSANLDVMTGTTSLGSDVYIERVDLASGVREQWMPTAQMATAIGGSDDMAFIEYVEPTGDNQGFIAPLQRLVRAQSDGETRKVLFDETVFQLLYAPSGSPDGKWIVFSAVNIPPIGKDPFPTTIPFNGTPIPNNTPTGGFDFFSWLGIAPQQAEAHGLPWDLFMVSSEGGAPIRLTTMDEDQPYPIWLDNSTIAFMGITGLYTLSINEDGSPIGIPTRIHDGAAHGGLSWSGP